MEARNVSNAPGTPASRPTPSDQFWGDPAGTRHTFGNFSDFRFLHFFRCYHSEELPVLIDMSIPSLIKIPEGSPRALPGALGCLCHPGPSFPVARGKPGVPAVQNEQGRKWDIQRKQSASRVVFAEDLDVSGHSTTTRPPIDPGPVPSAQKKFALDC